MHHRRHRLTARAAACLAQFRAARHTKFIGDDQPTVLIHLLRIKEQPIHIKDCALLHISSAYCRNEFVPDQPNVISSVIPQNPMVDITTKCEKRKGARIVRLF